MNYCVEYSKFLYLQSCIEEQAKMERYIQECCALANGEDVYEKIRSINEATISDFFDKIKDWVVTIFNKFLIKLKDLSNANIKFLKENKELILSKKLDPNATYTMNKNIFDGIKRIVDTIVPGFNYDDIIKYENLDQKKYVDAYIKPLSEWDGGEKKKLSTFATEYFLGAEEGKKDFKSDEIDSHIADMYNFCLDRGFIYKKISDDKNNIKKACDTIKKAMIDAANNAAKEAKNIDSNENSNKEYYASFEDKYTDKSQPTDNSNTNSSGGESK